MKIAISSTGKNLTDEISGVFARCPYFIVAEIEDEKIQKIEAIENKSANQLGQAGISAAQLLAEMDVKVIITSNISPRALDVLNQFGIEVYQGKGTINEVIGKFIEGKLEKVK
jgi:predicted Fe-Mo cluster-binding NifX family protein